jgi:hypothetical protein
VLPQDCSLEGGLLQAVLRVCQETQEIITLEMGMEAFSGRVKEFNGLYLTMDLLDYFGNRDEEEVFELRDIGVVQLRSGEEWMYRRLEKWQASEAAALGKAENADENHDSDHIS